MDESDIYANMETPSGYLGKREYLPECSESIYANEDTFQTLETHPAGPARSGARDVKRRYRTAVVFLGLLCILLLVGLIIQIFQYFKHNSEWKTDMMMLHDSNNNLTKERDQLQTSCNNLAEQYDQLQTSCNNLAEQRDQLQTSCNNLAEQRDQFRRRLEEMTRERNDLQKKLQDQSATRGWMCSNTSLYYISTLQKSWGESRAYCQDRGADLMIINSKEEQDFARRFRKPLWIGLTDRETEGTWKWVDGTQLRTRYWASNEPNGDPGRDEDCVEIKMYDAEYNWNDESCRKPLFWICEKTLAP